MLPRVALFQFILLPVSHYSYAADGVAMFLRSMLSVSNSPQWYVQLAETAIGVVAVAQVDGPANWTTSRK